MNYTLVEVYFRARLAKILSMSSDMGFPNVNAHLKV